MSTPRSSVVPARILFFLSFLSASFVLLMSAPQAASPADTTYCDVSVSRLVPDTSEAQQLQDPEADFVRALIDTAVGEGLDLTDPLAVAAELRPYYPDLIMEDDQPDDVIYKFVWVEGVGWARVCETPDTLILDRPMEMNPIVISIRNGMILG